MPGQIRSHCNKPDITITTSTCIKQRLVTSMSPTCVYLSTNDRSKAQQATSHTSLPFPSTPHMPQTHMRWDATD